MASLAIVLGLGAVASALPHHGSLLERQDGACNDMASCTLTQEEWQSLDIDGFLVENILSVGGNGENFPFNFGLVQIATDGNLAQLGECGSLDGTQCTHAEGVSQLATFNCPSIAAGPEDRCLRYNDARAAIVIENYIQLREGIQAQSRAVANARDNLVNSNFVSDLLDGMAQEEGDFIDEILEFVLSLPLSILTSPFQAVRVAMEAFKIVDSLTIDLIPGGPGLFIQQAQANNEIGDEKERVKDQMSRQLDLIVSGEQARLAAILEVVFTGGNNGFQGASSIEEARNTVTFQLAQSGAYLNPRASQEELDAAAEESLKNVIVTSVMRTFGWQVIRTFNLALEIPGRPGDTSTCRQGQKGLPNTLGSPCVVFRRGSNFDDPRMQNPDVIEHFVDWPAMAQNADECKGGDLDPAFNPSNSDGDGLPPCFYNFQVNTSD